MKTENPYRVLVNMIRNILKLDISAEAKLHMIEFAIRMLKK